MLIPGCCHCLYTELAAAIPPTEVVGKGDYFRFGMRDSLAIEASFLQVILFFSFPVLKLVIDLTFIVRLRVTQDIAYLRSYLSCSFDTRICKGNIVRWYHMWWNGLVLQFGNGSNLVGLSSLHFFFLYNILS